MLYGAQWLQHLQTPDPIWRPYAFDRVTVSGKGGPILSLVGRCWSEYQSGPNLCHLAEVAGYFQGPGFYGLHSCRPLGFRPE